MSALHLALKAEHFAAIAANEKPYEFRLYNEYWRKRIEDREFDEIVLTLGYPAKTDVARRMKRPWQGYLTVSIVHKEFGPEPVKAFAIIVN